MAEQAAGQRGAGERGGLKPSLKSRHMIMISLGGVIGAGLFVGGAAMLDDLGPAAVLTSAVSRLHLVLI